MQRKRISRRRFLNLSALGLASAAAPVSAAPAVLKRRPPNLLFIHTDQQFNDAIAAHGCPHLKTPQMDRLAARGISFRLSYSANPVCCPARAAWFTGRPPSENGVVVNQNRPLLKTLPDLGQWFGARGYEPVYAGKWHITGRSVGQSFKVLTPGTGIGEHSDGGVARAAQQFLSHYRGDKPFFLSLGFLQPHDICYWVFAHTAPLAELPFPELAGHLPPMWENWGYDPREPETFRRGWRASDAWKQISKWPQWQWRYYRWSYYRHVEMVDAQIGLVLDALEDAGLTENTVIIFSADHGDGMGAHQLWQKMYFYEEAVRVPLILSWPGQVLENVQDTRHLVSGLDVAPTLCDFAGIELPPLCRGRSLRPLAEGKTAEWREYLVSEVAVTGRMVRTPEWKFITYRGDSTDQLFDMRRDPGELHNLAPDGRHADVIADLRKRLADWESHLQPAPGALSRDVK
ncbi:MAG: sulfatase-like hydrolase/transferase [Candidatus Sumerlaeia bacterium]|nr:sulfatase-like hydrolase/transferase [Candidatus Sumerlaeia bacterium]